MKLPLEGITILEFSQYMAGPYAGLRLADLGARVIKVERPKYGDACRQLVTKNMKAGDDSVLFHTANRNKESFQANLKDPADVEIVKKLIGKVDVITHNFRPGIMERLGLDFDSVKNLNPKLIYAEISGYGTEGPWRNKPGQDLLAQALSGLTWLTGNKEQNPIPFGAAVADMVCGSNLVQAILAALVRRNRKDIGAKIEISLIESILDFQFEGLTAYLNKPELKPQRSHIANAHTYLGAPYGIYGTQDWYIALAMGSMAELSQLLDCPQLSQYTTDNRYFTERDEAKAVIAEVLKTKTTAEWLSILEPAGYWCSDIYDYKKLMASKGYQALQMEQQVVRGEEIKLITTRCPIRINGQRLTSDKAAPVLGSGNARIGKEFGL
ncbi:CaiB/BaiF CoA-transferase family protein [Vibrio sp. CK2-1]|uniref:CaiB/BaiF CoA transferase family protein n=1 Tax=Vibrio sp. CK2-1 TaxID=2912249 RepID=UPI001F22C57C|nr:CaiB/BaiF CoA-transferase family protein [Vibrio sp. CK2-1]MCF7352969.1 CoA transferase [Vibrio sp. CK2-1]